MAKAARITRPDRDKAKAILSELWDRVIDDEMLVAPANISEIINAEEVGMRFCLPIQLLGKLTDNTLDALCLQLGASDPGLWNARTFGTAVIVPWNRANQSVLGGSSDPYVSHSMRKSRVDDLLEHRDDPKQWETVCSILRDVETQSNSDHTKGVFLQVLAAVRDRLRKFDFTYVVPTRISLRQAETVIVQFLAERSGGDRGLAVAAALFETIRERFGAYTEVRRGVINAADAATESVGDLECVGQDGNVVLAVEVKERRIGADDLHIAVAKAREFDVRELLFCAEGITATQREQVELTTQTAWASGTNIYHATIHELMHSLLPLTGEQGLRSFIVHVGQQLDAFNTQPKHRNVWKTLLDAL